MLTKWSQHLWVLAFPLLYLLACQPHAVERAKPTSASNAKTDTSKSRVTYDSLHFILTEHYTDLTTAERQALRKTLMEQATWPFDVLCPATEPGTHILLKGQVTDNNGTPLPGAHLHIFHTNYQGYYSPLDSITGKMMENDPRLEGFITTDANGEFEIRTVRPASYPKKYKDRFIPQHVHINVTAEGYEDGIFQVVFEDDPFMDEYWTDWAHQQGFPIVKLAPTPKGVAGAVQLILKKE